MFLKDGVLYEAPPIPHKHEIIPIHASDISSFKSCRRRWDWSSPARNNLRRKVTIFGLDPNLWFGTGIHYALEHYYNPTFRRDPVESFLWWFELQWNGGIVTEDQLELSYDLKPAELGREEHLAQHPDGTEVDIGDGPMMYRVKGLRDLLPSPDHDEWMGYRDLGEGMMTFYKDYAEREDDFTVVSAEAKFSIPLGFEATDIREESPNYGKTLEVHLRGKRDGIIYFPARDSFALIEAKTAARVDEDYFLKLENDPQATTYCVATLVEANMYDLPWKQIDGVLFNVMKKNHPTAPTITTRGIPSLDRQNEGTTATLFMECIKDSEFLQLWYQDNEKAVAYYEYLLEKGDELFIQRKWARRNKYEIAAMGEELIMVAKDMLDDPKIYKTPTGYNSCTRCSFRAPCLAKDDGSEWQGMLVDSYDQNRDR